MRIKLMHGDCLELMRQIPNRSVDMVLCDLPYGTTACKWDSVIPFEPLWEQYKRIVREMGAIVLFGKEPFSSNLRLSNLQMFKYDWIWIKNNSVGFTNAHLQPMKRYEIISVFSRGKTSNGNECNMPYYPQGLQPYGKELRNGNKKGKENSYWRPSMKSSNEGGYFQKFTNYPTDCLFFDKVVGAIHPTQKPIALCEYLIKTYTHEGETVLDNCMGSGSTGVACVNTNRNFIGIEKDEKYFNIAKARIEKTRATPRQDELL